MYSDSIEHICAYCFYSERAKGLETHLFCNKRKEYRGISADACKDYLYDITKRPVRRHKGLNTDKNYNFDI